jgi:cell wall-associated NlpC family hydrolase
LNQWDQLLQNAAAEFGEPSMPHTPDLHPATVGPLMKAMMAIESGGRMYDANGEVIVRDDGFGDGLSVGLLQVKPQIWGELAEQLHADPFDPAGNIRLGTAIMADAIDRHGSWEAALTRVYFPSNDPNGTTQNEYVTAVRGLIHEQGASGTFSGPTLSLFPAPRDFHVRPDARASGRRGPTLTAAWIKDFGPGAAVACDGVFSGEAVQGDANWLRTSDPEHLAIHASAFLEAIAPGGAVPAVAGGNGQTGAGAKKHWVVTTTATKLRAKPRGDVLDTLPVNTRLRVAGDADHGFLPVAVPGAHARGWVDREDVIRIGEPDADAGGQNGNGSPADGTGDVGDRIAAEAHRYVGRPYQLGTHGPNTFDCSGLVHWVVLQVTETEISPDSHAQFNLGAPVARNQLQPGDLVFYDTQAGGEVREDNTASHVGIVVDNGQMVNALNEDADIIVSDPFSAYFAPRYLGARRLFG